MKVIVNNQTSLTVENENGNVLFQWLPQENTYTFNINKNVFSEKQLRDAIQNMKIKGIFY